MRTKKKTILQSWHKWGALEDKSGKQVCIAGIFQQILLKEGASKQMFQSKCSKADSFLTNFFDKEAERGSTGMPEKGKARYVFINAQQHDIIKPMKTKARYVFICITRLGMCLYSQQHEMIKPIKTTS